MRDYICTSEKYLSDDEFARLEKTLHANAKKDPRNTLIFFLLLYTGARPSELLAAKISDVDWGSGLILLRGIKNSRDRDIPLPAWLFDKLKSFKRAEALPHERIFPIAYNTLGEIWRQYRPCEKTLRCTRHTFAIRVYKKCKDARIVQKMLGHKWLGTTEIYLDYAHSQEEFRRLLCD